MTATGALGLLGLVSAICFGVVLRLWGLPGQIVFGDELHAVESVVGLDLKQILTTYRLADHCIPMAAYDRLLVAAGVPLTEGLIRLPSVIAGLVTLVALPLAVERGGGLRDRATGVFFGLLVALSPSLVFYSRIARPYATVVLLGFGAAASFWRFRQTRRAAWGLAYAVLGAAASWFHPGVAPFVAAPLAFAGVEALAGERAERRRRLGEVIGLGALLAGFVALFLVPAWPSFVRLLQTKGADAAPGLSDLLDMLLIQSGSVSPWVAVPFWAIVAVGLGVLLRRERSLALYSATLLLVQGAAVGVFRPSKVEQVLVVNRYMLVALPVVLLWAACGLGALWGLSRGRVLGRLAVVALALGLLATHPYVSDPGLRLGPFGASNAAAAFSRRAPELPEVAIPEVYRLLGRESGPGAVVEVPSTAAWHRARPELALSRVHGRPVLFGTSDPWRWDPGVSFTTLIPTQPEAVLASGARFLVLDLDRQRLWVTITMMRRRGIDPSQVTAEQYERAVRRTPPGSKQAQFARWMVERFEAAWGPPQLVDGPVRVWDLAVVAALPADGLGRGVGAAEQGAPAQAQAVGVPEAEGAER